MTIYKREKGSTVLWILGLLALAVVAYFVFRSPNVATNPEPTGTVEGVQQSQTVTEGEVVCLPHRNTTGPTTMECAYGLKTSDGKYYGLDTTGLIATTVPAYETGDHISVEGDIKYQADIDPRFWSTYSVVGMIKVADFWKFTEK